MYQRSVCLSAHNTKQLLFENKHPLFVFLVVFKCLVILPPYQLFALAAGDVANDMSSSRHATLILFAQCDIDDVDKKIGFAVRSTEILGQQKGWMVSHMKLGQEGEVWKDG